MAQRTVSVNVGPGNSLALASKIIGAPGASANRIIEAAIRTFRGEPREQVISRVTQYDGRALSGGGKKFARLDEELLTDIDNISQAGRIGLAMLMYDLTREEAIEWEANRGIKPGRPRKEAA